MRLESPAEAKKQTALQEEMEKMLAVEMSQAAAEDWREAMEVDQASREREGGRFT